MNKRLSQNISLISLFVLPLLFLIMTVFFLWLTPGYNISLVNVLWDSFFGAGGGCQGGPDIALYDRNGARQDFFETTSTYVGVAPLYQPDPNYPEFAGLLVCDYPSSLPADVVTSWSEVYPLFIQLQLPEIFEIESKSLEVQVRVETQFSGKGINEEFPVLIQTGAQIPVWFTLNAPKFDFGPPNDTNPIGFLQIGSSISHQWSIGPKDGVFGEQFIYAQVNGIKRARDGRAPYANFKFNVQHRDDLPLALRSFLIGRGVRPAQLVNISAIFFFITSLFGVGKFGLELYKLRQDIRQLRNKGQSNPPSRPTGKSTK